MDSHASLTREPASARAETERRSARSVALIVGLILFLGLGGWFGWQAWSMRTVWSDLSVLNDARAPEARRLQAALDLSRDPKVDPSRLCELSLRTDLPDLARYILAEGVTSDLVANDPTGYATMLAKGDDWPSWLRLILARPLAYAATQGHPLSRELVAELCRKGDSRLRLWSLYTLALQPRPDPRAKVVIEAEADNSGPDRELARLLIQTLSAGRPERLGILDRATQWTRAHDPDASRVWDGWRLSDDVIERVSP